MCAGHQLCRYNGNVASAVYSKSQLNTAVNESDPKQTRGWYHPTQSPSPDTEHSIDPFYDRDEWDMGDLPHDYKCEGSCSDMFRSPYRAFSDHRKSCGTGKSVDRVVIEDSTISISPYDNIGTYSALVTAELQTRNFEQGCGRPYYHCPTVPDTKHEPQTCSVSGCTVQYRNCLRHTKDHSNHSGEEGSTEHQTIAPDPAPTPTPSYHTCGVHETWQSGDHSAASCGTSGHYVCDGSDHSLQASCLVTNANGDYCTVTSFYACQYHTHVYPAPPPTPSATCARSACGQTVSDRLEHRQICAYGHTYWTCYPGATHNHTTTFTCRRPGCGVTFTRCSNGTCTSDWGTHNYHWASD